MVATLKMMINFYSENPEVLKKVVLAYYIIIVRIHYNNESLRSKLCKFGKQPAIIKGLGKEWKQRYSTVKEKVIILEYTLSITLEYLRSASLL